MSLRIERPSPDPSGGGEGPAPSAPPSVPQRLATACQTLLEPSPTTTTADRLEVARRLQTVSRSVDAYVTMGGVSQARGPPLDWTHFRKAYSVALWIKPNLVRQTVTTSSPSASPTNRHAQLAYDRSPSLERCLYRFATEPNEGPSRTESFSAPSRATGVVVHTSPWVLVQESDEPGDDASSAAPPRLLVETILTAMTLPCLETLTNSNMSTTRRVSYPLRLTANEWHYVCCTHVNPYLKRPQWTVAVDGQVLVSAELDYPTMGTAAKLSTSNDAMMMQDVVFLQNIAAGGVWCPSQDKDALSSLQDSVTSLDGHAPAGEMAPLTIDMSGLGIYPDAIPPNVQAVVAASTQGNCLTAFGMVPSIPPVANWSKGSSASEGLPKVGIPLMVHATALDIQKLSDHLVFGVSANDAYVVGQDGRAGVSSPGQDGSEELGSDQPPPHQRIIITMPLQPGSMSDTPRVGLVQPGQPVRIDRDDLPSLYVTGSCRLTRAWERFWQQFGSSSLAEIEAANQMAPWSVAVLDQGVVTASVLPFFLSLAPPGKLYGAHDDLYVSSIRQLYDLYKDQGQYAAQLIRLLGNIIETGGARVHEEVLQSGCIHSLATALRLSLIRANRIQLLSTVQQQPKNWEDVVTRLKRFDDEGTLVLNSSSPISPRHIPGPIIEACERLIHVCCGPRAKSIEALSPAHRVIRTSDLALTTMFTFALDFDLWGGDAEAGTRIYRAVADRYGGFCITYGYIVRSQISVQYLLDSIRVCYDNAPIRKETEEAGMQLCKVLTSMLLASLSNRRSVSQAEQDISACVRALTDASLGSLIVHIVLNSLVEVLVFCEVLPCEMALFYTEHHNSDEHKMQVAARMGRNILTSDFLDVVGPVVLSRTVSSGDAAQATRARNRDEGPCAWENHWRLCLLLFSWIASVAGSEGLAAATSTGRLLLASGHAGSLTGALDGVNNDLITTLFLPTPAVAQIIGYALRSDWTYQQMLSDRLQIMTPLLPGIISTLTPQIKLAGSDECKDALKVLLDLMVSVGAAFQRVYGDIRIFAGSINKRDGTSEVIKTVKSLAPNLVVIALMLEHLASEISKCDSSAKSAFTARDPSDTSGHWNSNEDPFSFKDVLACVIDGSDEAAASDESCLHACANCALLTAAALFNVSFSYGGAGAAHSLWKLITESMKNFVVGSSGLNTHAKQGQLPSGDIALNQLCRLLAIVLKQAMKRRNQWDTWSYEQASAVSALSVKIHETDLLSRPLDVNQDGLPVLSSEQMLLLFATLEILAYGRDLTGWCQLPLPTMSTLTGNSFNHHPSAASGLMLPVLQPCLKIALRSLAMLSADQPVELVEPGSLTPTEETEQRASTRDVSIMAVVLKELDLTITAAIVGLAFPAACDLGIRTLVSLEKTITNSGQAESKQINALYLKVVEELRVRLETERQLKERALLGGSGDPIHTALREAAEDSEAVERLILGNFFGADETITFRKENSTSHLPVRPDELLAALHEYKSSGDRSVMVKYIEAMGVYACDVDGDADCVRVFDWNEAINSQVQVESDTLLTQATSLVSASFGPETAADAVGTFFESATAEKSRLAEVSARFFLNQRCNKLSYTERWGWARHTELSASDSNMLWERGVPDGNRDVRSRIPTVPCFPEFRKFVPSFLDHYADKSTGETTGEQGSDRVSVLPDIDTLTKHLLEAGTLEIVDITKKITDEDEDDDEITGLMEEPLATSNVGLDDDEADYLPPCESTNQDYDFMNASEEKAKIVDTAATTRVSMQALVSNSAFSTPPDNSSSSVHLMHSSAGIEYHLDDCLHVRAEGSRICSLLLSGSHLILEYEALHNGLYEGEVLAAKEDAQREQILKDAGEYNENDPEGQFQQKVDKKRREIALMRPQSNRWNLSEVSHVYLRRYRLRDSALEIFFIPSGGSAFGGMGAFGPSSTLFLDFGSGREGLNRRDDIAFAIMQRSPPQAIKQWPDRSAQFLHDQLNRLTLGWAERRISNFDYLLHLNMLAGRSYNDICQYPVFPWVLSDYTSEKVPDLTDPKNFRDLSKPMGALNDQRLAEFKERFESFVDPSIPPFMYGSHYSTSAGVVLHFLVRLHPFAGLHRQLQSGHFDVADRLFCSVPRTWSMCTGTSAAEVKELTPEWYCNPAFLRNSNRFKLGTSQDGDVLDDVILPPWAEGSPEKFIEIMRAALESEVCSSMLPNWIDLIFGRKQQGSEAIEANNVFFYLTYYGSVDVASIQDESLRQATELQIAHFGQCPMQLFRRHHIPRFPVQPGSVSFYQCISAYNPANLTSVFELPRASDHSVTSAISGTSTSKPFSGSPISYWVHLDAPPPGPHGALISVRFAGTDRCLAVDDKGIFHTFRWAWRAEEQIEQNGLEKGCFIAQRELPRFRTVPRLMHTSNQMRIPAVAISKTLFAGRSVLLVLSDGDGKGGISMQLVDPSKGSIRGEVLIPGAHSSEITCITTDPIGTAAGHGGVGGELALVGSADGCASLWRFMSSHYLPLRPRARLSGHNGAKIVAVAINSTIHIAATVSAERICLHSTGNGNLIRAIKPPKDSVSSAEDSALSVVTRFADTPAIAVSSQGSIVVVCETLIEYPTFTRAVTTLTLFSIEGEYLGSRPMERWRGMPHRMMSTPDGTAVLVCSGRGVTVHRLSCLQPLEIIDEWVITESDELSSADKVEHCYDLDLGPSLNRPVAAAAACSNGVLRLHALPGISKWSERHKKSGLGSTVGNAFVKPAQSVNRALQGGLSFGSRIAGLGRDIGKEVSTDVKVSGVSGFLGNLMKKRSNASGANSK